MESHERTNSLNLIHHRLCSIVHSPMPQFLKSIILVKLRALQLRANIYVVYYGIFSKSRLKFVMMEDALQYGTQDCFESVFHFAGKFLLTFEAVGNMRDAFKCPKKDIKENLFTFILIFLFILPHFPSDSVCVNKFSFKCLLGHSKVPPVLSKYTKRTFLIKNNF